MPRHYNRPKATRRQRPTTMRFFAHMQLIAFDQATRVPSRVLTLIAHHSSVIKISHTGKFKRYTFRRRLRNRRGRNQPLQLNYARKLTEVNHHV